MNFGVVLLAIILAPSLHLVFTIMRGKRIRAEQKMGNEDFTVMLPPMVANIGAACASMSVLVMLGFTLLSKELPHFVFYVIFGMFFWLGMYLVIKTLTFKVVVEGPKITVHSAIRKPYSFAFSEITSVTRQVKNNKVDSERMVIRTASKKKLIVESAEISYKKLVARIKAETNGDK